MTSVASCFDAWVAFSNSPELDASARAPHTKYRSGVGGSWRRMPRGRSTGLGPNAETCKVPSGCDRLAKQEIPTVFKSRSSRP